MNIPKVTNSNSVYVSASWGRLPLMLLMGLLLLALTISGCALSGSETGSSSILFSAGAGGDVDIYAIDGETGDPVRLTSADRNDFAPAWSPNNSKIAFLSKRNVYSALWVMDSLGDSKSQISDAGVEVVAFRWSPDSSKIGVEIVRAGSHSIHVIVVESKQSIALTSIGEDVRMGDWSPDGQWLAYSAVAGDESGIRRRNPTGVDEITLTVGDDIDARWSKNGQWIAFKRKDDDGSTRLIVMDKDGENETVVALGISATVKHDWAPDSKQVVYVSETTGNAEVYTTKHDGKDTEQLTSNRVIDSSPRWSSKGSEILFLSEGDGSYDVYSMQKSGEQQVRKTSISALIVDIDW
jgi:Tol biopolymer transport system component